MKYCLILGAGSGIAKAVAVEFAKAGFNLYLAGRNTEDLSKIASDLEIRYNIIAFVKKFDVLKYDSHAQFFNELEPKPEVVISAVGLLGDQTVAEKDFISAKLVMDTNYTGVVSILNEVSSYFEVQGSGTIVGISSVAGERGRMKNYIYGSAKAAFTAYLSGLRQRLSKKGVHILSVQPGFVNTKMIEGLETPKRLTAEPEQVAKLIFNAYKKKKSVIFTPSYWRVIMTIIKLIPEKVFQRLQL